MRKLSSPPSRRAGLVLAAATLMLSATPFAKAQFNTNLIVNAGAEAGLGIDGSNATVSNLPGWNRTGEMVAIAYSLGCPGGYPCLTDPGPPNPGLNHFAGGNAAASSITQTVDLGFAGSAVNGTGAYFALSGWLGGYASQTDYMTFTVNFKNASQQVVGSSVIGPVTAADRGNATGMLLREATGFVPLGAQTADVTLLSTRDGGTSNDGYADNLGFSIVAGNVAISAPGAATVGSFITAQVAVNSPFAGAYAGTELLAFGFDLGFDTAKLRLAGVQVAPGWDDDTALFSDISVAGSHFPGVADSGQGSLSLATLSFEVLAEGNASIEVRSDSKNNPSEGLTYYGASNNAELFGRAQLVLSAVPEPGTGALLAAGTAMLVFLRRRLA